MRIVGITLEANKALFCALEKKDVDPITEIQTIPKKLELKNHMDADELRQMMVEIHHFLESEKMDRIGILIRGTKGRFAASPISFKIEGLIQLFPHVSVEFVAPAALRAFYKKNENPIAPKFAYQKDACDLSFYLLQQS